MPPKHPLVPAVSLLLGWPLWSTAIGRTGQRGFIQAGLNVPHCAVSADYLAPQRPPPRSARGVIEVLQALRGGGFAEIEGASVPGCRSRRVTKRAAYAGTRKKAGIESCAELQRR
jgi:hypothetical protein